MKLTLHIGAHRTGSTSFQTYLRQNKRTLADLGIGFWGPVRMRRGLAEGVIARDFARNPEKQFLRAIGRIKLQRAQSLARGIGHVVVSEENIIGTMRHNFASASLYASAGDRISRFAKAFGPVSSIVLTVRSLDSYWTSALTYSILKGFPVASRQKIDRIADQTRNWRDVITDVARAVPDVPMIVTPYERVACQPHRLVSHLTANTAPPPADTIWRNERPSVSKLLTLPLEPRETVQLMEQTDADKWVPFSVQTRANLHERYLDDIFWLRAGADGLASFFEGPPILQAGEHLPQGVIARGQTDDERYRLARPG